MKELEELLPIIPLRGMTVFPNMVTYFDVGREKSINAVKEAMNNDGRLFLLPQKEDEKEDIQREDVLSIGTLCSIKQIVNFNSGTMRVLVEGLNRARIKELIVDDSFIKGTIEILEGEKEEKLEVKVLKDKLITEFTEFLVKANLDEKVTEDTINSISEVNELIDIVTSYVVLDNDEKKKLLEIIDLKERLEFIITLILKEKEIVDLEKKIKLKLNKNIDKNQKNYYLKEQLNIIKEELGENDESTIKELKLKLKKAKMSKNIKEKINIEIGKLEKDNLGSQEKAVVESYLDEIFSIPWGIYNKEVLDVKKSKAILNEAHYGLKEVKEEILEYLAIKELNKSVKLPILCLVGPPGVGKTSIAKSIAKSLHRNFERISLGGINEESDIRGHRKTYVGAMPGRIVDAVKKSKSMNSVILLDEIDKVSLKHNGDPYSALLEVLDKEQNKNFRDHYLEVDIDLSEMLFIATANSLNNVPRALLDRMTIIEISGYSYEEKKYIAKNHLIPKILKDYGVKEDKIKISDNAIYSLISDYTRESGVRELSRIIDKVIKKAIKYLVENKKEKINITVTLVEKFLGDPIFSFDKLIEEDSIGVVNGMAWTAYGGDTLSIEALMMDGTGKLQLTGKLGEVMQESVKAAYSYVRANLDEFSIKEKDFYKNKDIHIHVPEGAVPKDGPSAGITMVTAIVSVLTKRAVKQKVAMTGEVTLTGKVLPIGGLKEKILAAKRVGIDTIIIPKKNEKDLKKIPKKIRENIKVILVNNVKEVIDNALI
ncbi:MAG: endopeptidase La [Sarcina sp.]